MAKPDNRKDNVDKLQHMLRNTEENYRETEQYLNEHADEISPQEQQQLIRKNKKRAQSITGFREEIVDEAHDQEQDQD